MIRTHKQADIFISGNDIKILKRMAGLASLKLEGKDVMIQLNNEERTNIRKLIDRIIQEI